MKRLLLLTAMIFVIGGTANGIAKSDHCDTLLPKGGGTVVHGQFVRLNPGESLLLCHP